MIILQVSSFSKHKTYPVEQQLPSIDHIIIEPNINTIAPSFNILDLRVLTVILFLYVVSDQYDANTIFIYSVVISSKIGYGNDLNFDFVYVLTSDMFVLL